MWRRSGPSAVSTGHALLAVSGATAGSLQGLMILSLWLSSKSPRKHPLDIQLYVDLADRMGLARLRSFGFSSFISGFRTSTTVSTSRSGGRS
jgi:hypothetical protein